ncbi:hypothetical protein MY7_1649 [Bacillus sp. 5B6]|nr:hypothetical protein MY7_1649 [Bacillus sp. 5B6]RAP14787.1 hypothetical protein HS9_00110 [Bacillus velezensis]
MYRTFRPFVICFDLSYTALAREMMNIFVNYNFPVPLRMWLCMMK